MKRLKNRIWLLAILLFVGFTTCIYAPFEMYLNNADSFWFDITHFWWIPLVCGGFAMLAGAMLGCFFKGKILLAYEGALFGFGFAAYIQGNFLNLDVGLMDGTQILWENYQGRFLWNGAVWCLCIFLCPFLMVKVKEKAEKSIGYGACMLTAMQAVALIALLAPNLLRLGQADNIGYLSERDVYHVNREENILVFVLDMFDDVYLDEILKLEPELAKELDGFTQYTNITGNYSTTQYSILSLASGKYCFNETGWMEWRKEIGEERLYLDEFRDNGFEVGIYLQEEFVPDRLKKQASNYEEAPLRINHYKDFTIDLYRLVTCRYFPDFVKPYMWMDGSELERWKEPDSEYGVWSTENFDFHDGLNENGVTADLKKRQIKLIHLNGSHPPYNMDEYCNRTWAGEVTPVQCGRGALRILQKYMEELKREGVYDQTSIIITADHGYYYAGVLTNPALLIKGKGERGELRYSDVPVSQSDLPATMLDLGNLECDGYGTSIYNVGEHEERHRKFYQYYLKQKGPNGNCRLIEYEIDDASNEYESFHLTDVEYTWDGKKQQHSPGCKLCQAGGPTQQQLEEYTPPRVVHEQQNGEY